MRSTVFEVGYVGNRGVKLFTFRDINQPRIYGDFLNSFKELQAYCNSANGSTCQNNGPNPSASNTIVRILGTPATAISTLAASTITQGLVGTAVNTIDRVQYTKYGPAGVADTYLRPFPQFNQVYREFFAECASFPARTTVNAAPPRPGVLVEIECIAGVERAS